MKANLKQQGYWVIGIVLAVAVGYPICAFLPRMRAISKVRKEIREKQDFVSQTEKLRPLVAQQKATLQSTFDYVEGQRAQLVPHDGLSHIFSRLSELTKESGTTTTRFEPQPAIAYDTFKKVPIKLGVTGSTAAVSELLSQIENLPQTIWIDGLSLNAASEAGGLTRCDVELAIFVDNREISN